MKCRRKCVCHRKRSTRYGVVLGRLSRPRAHHPYAPWRGEMVFAIDAYAYAVTDGRRAWPMSQNGAISRNKRAAACAQQPIKAALLSRGSIARQRARGAARNLTRHARIIENRVIRSDIRRAIVARFLMSK